MIRLIRIATFLGTLGFAGAHAQVTEYTATYAAEYKGRSVGDSVFSLHRSPEADLYVFDSTLQARGLLRLASPRPVVDRAEFRIAAGALVPLSFRHEDGSRRGEDSHTIAFDQDLGSATITGDGYERELQLHDGVLDRGSLQVALMRSLQAGTAPTSFDVVDEDSVDTYSFEAQGSRTLTTPLGELETVTWRQQRAGSSRYTLIDFAPQLDFVPARIEQFRDGESQTVMQIESFERL